ncbi:T9SS type A sorting domain-containing protein [candidate division KSB1 bacterium]|nr:T9SS type A sorting domain-containing protein [candidate division KSB1 bacterium]
MMRFSTKFSNLILIVLLFITATVVFGGVTVQDDTVSVPDVEIPPVIDGIGSDPGWADVPWQTIDQVWIPYGGTLDPSDCSGRYKVIWSSTENLLYFLIEVTDDIGVDGYIPGQTADIYHFDMVEVFIDENDSGGKHTFDGTGSTGEQYGYNAENAFAYHIYADIPTGGGVTTECYVGDIAGSGWGDRQDPNYADHLPEFAFRNEGNIYTREFSLSVYDDTYNENPPETSRVELAEGKLMGLSIAICENDGINENPKTRDNFLGSVWVPEAKYNDHWIDADDFGAARLVKASSAVKESPKIRKTGFNCFPNPSSGLLNFSLNSPQTGDLKVTVYNILGREVASINDFKSAAFIRQRIPLAFLPQGVYFVRAEIGGELFIQKVTLTRGT